MSESRGGRHGEATASHDGAKKKQQEGETEGEAEFNEGQENDPEPQGERIGFEDRQGRPSIQNAAKSVEKGGFGMSESTEQSAKSVAKILSTISNDPRITNVMMLVIVAIGLGVHESIQTQMCSL